MICSSSIAQVIFDTTSDGVIAIDSSGIIQLYNPAAGRMFGYGPEEVVGQSVSLLMPESQRPEHEDHIRRYLDTNEAKILGSRRNIRGRRKDGSGIDLCLLVTASEITGERLFIGTLQRVSEADCVEETKRKVLAHLPVGLVHVSASGALLSANEEAQRILGLSWDELAERYVRDWEWETLHEDLSPCPAADLPVNRCLRTGEPQPGMVIGIRRPDGQITWAIYSAIPLFEPGSRNLLGVIVAFRDISERRHAEAALKANQARLRATLNAVPDFIFWMDGNGVFLDSKGDERELYAPPQSFIGKNMREVLPPELAKQIELYLHLALTTGKIQTYEYELSLPDRGMHFYEARLMRVGANEAIALVRDITERKRVEDRLKLALQVASVGIWEWDILTNQLVWDEQMYRLYGVRPDVFPVVYNAWRAGVHAEDQERVDTEIQRALRGDQEFSTEFRVVWPDASVHHIRAIGHVQRDSAGQPVRMIGTNWDISDRKQMEFALQKASQEAIAANRAKSAFLSRMSHEIRTPLNAMIAAADLLQEEITSPNAVHYIQLLKQGGVNLSSIVNDILELSAVESGRIVSESRDFSVRDLVNDAVAPIAVLAAKKGLAVKSNIAADVPPVIHADAVHLRQVLLNLLGNAVKFTQAGKVDVFVEIEGSSRLLLRVSDSGPGIPKEMQASIFDPYRNRPPIAIKGQGSGLGLSISKSFVELMSGTISFESDKKGTTFTVVVPFAAPKAAHKSRPEQDKKPAVGQRILIAEDNEVSAMLLRTLLTKLGATEITMVQNGQEALDQFRGAEFDLLLLDKHMPVLNGLDVVQIIRADEARLQRPPVRIAIVTADAFDVDRRQCLDAGCDYFLAKPITKDALATMLAASRSGRNSRALGGGRNRDDTE